MNDLPGSYELTGPNGPPGPMDRLNARLDHAERRLSALEQRIALLERAEKAAEAEPSALPAAAASPASASPLLPEVPQWQAGGIFPVLGRAMLGIAGAYLLRALTEAHVLPAVVLQFAAIVYTLLWLAAGTRAKTVFAAAVYACTSVLILAPMLWELTLRFKAMPAEADALTLAAFVVVAFVLARGPERAPVLRIANVSAAVLCLALAVATHVNLPFLGALLLTAAICQVASQQQFARPFIALAADLAVWMLIYIYRAPENTRVDYPALSAGWLVAPGCLLFAIFAVGVVLKIGPQRRRISLFDTVQVTVAFLLAACGLLYFGPSTRRTIFGLLCMALAAALYASISAWLRTPERANRIVFNVWSAALLLAGIWLCAPAAARPACLAVAAISALVAGAWLRSAALGWHCTVFLLASAWASGLLAYIFQALAGTQAGAPSFSICLTTICAALCYGLLSARPETMREGRPFAFLFASIAAVAAAALLAQGSASLAAAAFQVGPHHRALIRSFILCVAALALAFSGARWRRPELTHIGYGVVALEAIKLVVEDLRHGHLAYVAASVCLFAFTLIAIPRVAQRSREHKVA
jgi:hypothetical protein